MPLPTILDAMSPADLDMPAKFTYFRQIQKEMVDFHLYGPNEMGARRFACCGAPPGSGKTLLSQTIGQLSGMKYVVLTATRALEDQMVDDGFDIADIRGRANYTCRDLNPLHPDIRWTCEEGEEKECALVGRPGCTSFDRMEEARQARGVLSNYQLWMNVRSRNRTGLEKKGEPVGLLICDEAGKLLTELSRFLGTWVSNEDLHKHANKEIRELVRAARGEEWGRVSGKWVDALELVTLGIQVRQGVIADAYESEAAASRGDVEYRRLDKVRLGLERVTSHGRDNNWIWRTTKNGISFDCVWPGRYAEKYLWSGVERVVLLDGCLRQKTIHMLNIKATDMWFKEWPRQFPESLSPVYWVKNGRMGRKQGQDGLDKCAEVGERIYEEWAGTKKGVIHSVSYRLAEWLQASSKWGKHMYINERGEASATAERFRQAQAPAILVSPSYGRGFDFADEACEWIWIPKLPFPDRSDPVVIARCQDDPDYYNYETAQALVQSCLRGSRHERDRCTVMITDDAIGNFRNYARRHTPGWFRVRDSEEIPKCQ